jgi:multiple sugar transport system ATP-binding protein
MAVLELHDVRKSYETLEVIKGVNLTIADREFVVFVGPSGCGKSTVLRMIAGLEDITGGDLLIDGVRANDVPPDQRKLAMVFQSYALYPHMTVAENMGFALKMAGRSKAEIMIKVVEAARILQLERVLERRPKMLSGGQRQRVAIGRAIVRHPKAFLFDEPLSNLDAALRVQMRTELVKLHQDLHATMIYVTHDQVEAMTMADRIVVLNGGKVEQVGSPLELYHNPANRFVAGFIGSPTMNMVDAVVAAHADGGVRVALPGGAALDIPAPTLNAAQGTTITLGLRPEALELAPDGPFKGTADIVEHLGSETLVYVKSVHQGTLIVKTSGLSGVKPGDRVAVMAKADRACLFDGEGRSLMRRPLQKKDGFFL